MSTHRKVWKEFSYVKNDHSRDSQSSLSQSRSTQSFRFSQIKFNKNKNQQSQTSKKFILPNTNSRIKEFKHDRSFLQESNRMKENSMIEPQFKQPLKMSVETSTNRKLESKMKSFLYGVKKIHEDMKQFAENIFYSFQKMKNELQTNLLQVSSQLLKLGKSTSEIEKVHEIFHKGFAQIRRVITVLPESLTKFSNQCQQSIIHREKIMGVDVESPLLKFNSLPEGQSVKKIVSNFNINKGQESQRNSQMNTNKDLDLPLMSNQKLKSRPSTQRRQHLRTSSFDKSLVLNTQRFDLKAQKQPIQFEKSIMSKGPSLEQVTKIDDIIFQMRLILNQPN